MEAPRGIGPEGGSFYEVSASLGENAAASVCLSAATILRTALGVGVSGGAALGVFRRFQIAHFNDFFLSSHTVYVFRFVCCWLMSVAPKSS
jgi:hypothetical protein